ncbi:hypothetical protein [Neolewinella antarctica]|uniref:Addiction module component n=1 Tax=Neolewinella antarctica TaxID=442734 RepID=A0ABX0XE55_9BACT|nr:hypothetical protein [Neolewinella antarctica]NJC27078.1 hypothetical protein [Neolewinella antarctica]
MSVAERKAVIYDKLDRVPESAMEAVENLLDIFIGAVSTEDHANPTDLSDWGVGEENLAEALRKSEQDFEATGGIPAEVVNQKIEKWLDQSN